MTTPRTLSRPRLDQLLVERGVFASRARARDAILRGTVSVAGAIVRKSGQPVASDAEIAVADDARGYVSRAALKLVHGLDRFGLDPAGCRALDVGASTGGFTQVLLERGAAHVVAVDVGHGQMGTGLKDDPRVTCLEGLNARALTYSDLGGERPGFVVCDVSFISLILALRPALEFAAPGARGVFLLKPQFEVGRDGIGKGGLLRDSTDGVRIAESLREWLETQDRWRALGVADSPIVGGDGNREFLLAGEKAR